MAISEAYTGSAVTISTTEISLVSGTSSLQSDTSDGVFQVWIELTNMAKGDTFTFKLKEKVISSGTQRDVFTLSLDNAMPSVFVFPTPILMHGWDATLIRTAGSDRTFNWSIRKIA